MRDATETPGAIALLTPSIPGFELIQPLGSGPLTCVWAARDHSNDEMVALKFARPDCPDPEMAAILLEREAQAANAVNHPHLIRMRRVNLQPPVHLVMDLLPGESVRDRLRRDYQLEPDLALGIARQAAAALAALHRHRYVHGDVKPENIRLIRPGMAVLIDLGFAHRPGEHLDLLDRGLILGTANYLAPEKCDPGTDFDGRADVFSLGVTLFEMLTGTLPYPKGTTVETLRSHRHDRAASLKNHPLALIALLSRLLGRSPLRRPHATQVEQNLVGLEIALMLKTA